MTAEARFAQKHTRTADASCWLWTACRNHAGYGLFWDGTRLVIAHRWAYAHFVGPIPAGLVIDHLCGRRACVNYAQLEAAQQSINLLRGNTVNARNASKTHCPRGHPYHGDNLMLVKSRGTQARRCRTCHNNRSRLRRAKAND